MVIRNQERKQRSRQRESRRKPIDIGIWYEGRKRVSVLRAIPTSPLGRKLRLELPDLLKVRGIIKGHSLGKGSQIVWVKKVHEYLPTQLVGVDSTFPIAIDGTYVASVTSGGKWLPHLISSSSAVLSDWAIPLGEVKINMSMNVQDFDFSKLGIGSLEFELTCPHAVIPANRLALVIKPSQGRAMWSPLIRPVNQDGTLTGMLPAGNYKLQVIDVLTKVQLWASKEPVEVIADDSLSLPIKLKLGRMQLALGQPSDPSKERADMLIVVHVDAEVGYPQRPLEIMVTGNEYELFVPLKDHELRFMASPQDLIKGLHSSKYEVLRSLPLTFSGKNETEHINIAWPTR